MKLNRRQRLAALVGLAVVVLMALFPPVWIQTRIFLIHKHCFILQEEKYDGIRFNTLFKRIFVVGIATAGAVFCLGQKTDEAGDNTSPPSDG